MTGGSFIRSFCSVLLALHGCSCIADSTIELVTYNIGIVPGFIPLHNERREAAGTVLANSSADVLCLQEVWLQQHILDLVHATRSQFPYYHSLNSNGTPGQQVPIPQLGPCQGDAFAAHVQCVNASCRQLRSQLIELTGCSIVSCGSYLSALSQQCVNCLVFGNKVPSSDFFSLIVQECSSTPTDNYATTHGLLLLSKYPLRNKTSHSYHPDSVELVTRGYLAAEVDHLGPIACTHLATRLAPVYFGPPEFTTYGQLHANETQQILNAFPVNQNGTPPILMGDFNQGPAAVGLVAEYPASHLMMLQAGYYSPYMTELGICTWCRENPLTGNTSIPSVVDHIYVRNGTLVSGVKRILDNNMAVLGLVPISDHYGVQLTYPSQSTNLSQGTEPPSGTTNLPQGTEPPSGTNTGSFLSVTVPVVMAVTILQWLM